MCVFFLTFCLFPFSLRLPFGCHRLWPFSNSIILQFDFVLNLLCCPAPFSAYAPCHHSPPCSSCLPFFLSPTSIVLMCIQLLLGFSFCDFCSIFFACATFLHFFKWHFHFKCIFTATKLHLRLISVANTCHKALTTPGIRNAMAACREDTFLLKYYWYAIGHVGRIDRTLAAYHARTRRKHQRCCHNCFALAG